MMNAQLGEMEPVKSTLLEDAEVALEKLSHQEVQLVKETEELFKKQVNYIRLIDQLRNHVPDMNKIDQDTKKLSSLVDAASELVEDVCSKVRRIDLAKARLDDCLSKVGDILDLKTCRVGVRKALETNNYEEAAMNIKRFLSINQSELQRTISILSDHRIPKQRTKNLVMDHNDSEDRAGEEESIIDPKLMNSALEELDEARGRLLRDCQENFAQAVADDNKKDIERFLKIFPMLNEHQDGLKRYADYLRSKIVDPQIDETFRSKQINQADKLAALYENIAKLIDLHQPLIETYYGPGYLINVIRVIQRECDRLSRKILEEFRNETKLQYVAKMVRNSSLQVSHQTPMTSLQTAAPNPSQSKLDPRSVDNILSEISLIISRSEVYLNFIVQRIKDDLDSKTENEAQKHKNLLELYNLVCLECELNHLVQEVGGIYVMLEQFYLNESSRKAIMVDQIDSESSSCFVSSMLDDIFFIIKKCTKRAVSTKSNEVFCAIINHCVALLESTFCQVLEDRLKNQQYYSVAFTAKNLDISQAYSAIQSSRYLQSASELELAKMQYFSALNNLDKACDYIQTLRGILDADTPKLKTSLLVVEKQQTNHIEKSVTCLNELSQLVGKFSSVINSSLYQLFNASLRNRLKAELKTILAENTDLANLVSQNPDKATSLAKDLLSMLDRSLQDSLTVENYSKLVVITKEFLASSLSTLK